MPSIERVDVVELEPAIDEMARRSSDLNHDVLNHPKVRRIYNDGRELVLSTHEKYDLIISEPSNPYRAGVASLYTQEFYRAVLDRLTPNGLFIQWVQAYEVDGATVHTVLATARSVFEHVEVWQSIPGDLQLVCSRQPIRYVAEELRARLAQPELAAALKTAWNVTDLEGFLSHFLGNDKFVDGLTPMELIVPNTDERNYLEYGFATTVGRATEFSGSKLRDEAVKAGQHRPEMTGESIDWNEVDRYRIEFAWLFGGSFENLPKQTPELQSLARGYAYYTAGEAREALAEWIKARPEPVTDIDRLVRAQCHAEFADDECLELLKPIESEYPAEVATIRATYYIEKKEPKRAQDEIVAAFLAMREDAWSNPIVVRPLLPLSKALAADNPEFARRLFDVLEEPLAGRRMEQQRQLLRLMASEPLGDAEFIEAMTPLEPHPPWTEKLLTHRFNVYERAKHPLAGRAHEDLHQFLRNKKQK
jgi:hypothetical protein